MITCQDLAQMIEEVSSRDTYDTGIETFIELIQDADMSAIEWICRLVPASTLMRLRAMGERPLWGDGSLTVAEVSGDEQ